MSEQKTDVKKIIALKKAGWKTERIAAEMKMEPGDVDKAIYEFVNGGEKIQRKSRNQRNRKV